MIKKYEIPFLTVERDKRGNFVKPYLEYHMQYPLRKLAYKFKGGVLKPSDKLLQNLKNGDFMNLHSDYQELTNEANHFRTEIINYFKGEQNGRKESKADYETDKYESLTGALQDSGGWTFAKKSTDRKGTHNRAGDGRDGVGYSNNNRWQSQELFSQGSDVNATGQGRAESIQTHSSNRSMQDVADTIDMGENNIRYNGNERPRTHHSEESDGRANESGFKQLGGLDDRDVWQ